MEEIVSIETNEDGGTTIITKSHMRVTFDRVSSMVLRDHLAAFASGAPYIARTKN